MSDLPASYDDKLKALRLGYIGRLQREAAELREIEGWYHNASLGRDDLKRMHRLAHGLAGTGSVFGFPDISKAASPLDVMAGDLLAKYDDLLHVPLEDLRAMGHLLSVLSRTCQQEANACVVPAPEEKVPTTMPTGAYVLLVDDDRDLAGLLSARLQSRSIHVVTAASGSEAMKIIEHQAPDLVILDVMMPGLSGHDVLKRLKYDSRFSLIPVVMLSAAPEADGAETAKRLGAIDYIAKPFEADTLIAHLEKLLDAARFHVLITDNDDMLLDLLREKFRQRGFRVSTQNDGREAWDFIFKTMPDLVILDRMMPGMDGIAVLKNMRTEPETKNIPVIVLSARKEERDIQIGLQFGAQEYVTKPCDPEDLLNRSLALLQKSGPKKIRSSN
jgi:two-component system cell cycle response regulator